MRLTKKNEAFLGDYQPLGAYCDVTSKLGKLEDAEELCKKVTKQPFYEKIGNEITERAFTDYFVTYDFKNNQILLQFGEWFCWLKIDDYGKTWALTKEELNK